MGLFRKKPVVIEAHRWFENGDHPRDNSDRSLDYSFGLVEGEIVRYYRHPEVEGNNKCGRCGRIMDQHGWIDTLEGGHIVCPGDWIITGIAGENYPCKPDIFEATYEEVN